MKRSSLATTCLFGVLIAAAIGDARPQYRSISPRFGVTPVPARPLWTFDTGG